MPRPLNMYCGVKEQKYCLSSCSVVRTEYPEAESFIEERDIWGDDLISDMKQKNHRQVYQRGRTPDQLPFSNNQCLWVACQSRENEASTARKALTSPKDLLSFLEALPSKQSTVVIRPHPAAQKGQVVF